MTLNVPNAPCPSWVNRVTLSVAGLSLVYPDQRTSSDCPGMSGWCQEPTWGEMPITEINRRPVSKALKVGSYPCSPTVLMRQGDFSR